MSSISRRSRNQPRGLREAVAIAYDPKTDRAPVVVARGRGRIADRIVETAAEHGVTTISDPVALDALRMISVDQEVPPRVYHLVAEILAFVHQLKNPPYRE